MAGRPKRRALALELERRASAYFADRDDASDVTPLAYVCAWIENGGTITSLAADMTDVTRERLSTYLHSIYGENEARSRLARARVRSADAHSEAGLQAIADAGLSKEEISKASAIARQRNWMAEKFNRAEFGQSPAATVSISLGSLHLDALRAFHGASAKATVAPVETVVEAEITEAQPLKALKASA